MRPRFLYLLLLVGLAVSCSLYKSGKETLAQQEQAQKRIDGAKEEAKRLFATISTATGETQNLWGMSDFRIFGRDELTGMIGAGQVTVAKVSDEPETFEAVIPLWCEGKRLDGQPVKLSRQLMVRLLGSEDESKWEIPSYEFRGDQPLGFSTQLLTWLGWSFGGPILVFLFAWMWMSGWTRAALIVARVLALPLSGYAAHVSFGSALAVVVCLLAYVLVAFALIKMIGAISKK